VIILVSHSTMAQGNNEDWVPLRSSLDPKRLEETIGFLSQYYRFVSLRDAVDMLSGLKPVSPYSLVLTFDDGYRNNVNYALPVLQQYGAPATIFLTTGHIEKRKPFWFDRLDYALQNADVDGREFLIGGKSIRISARDRESLRESYRRLRFAAKAVSRDDREMIRELEKIAEALEKESGKSIGDIFEKDPWSGVLNWEEVRKTANEGILSFGSHTVNHIRLGRADDDVIFKELTKSKKMIEDHTGMKCWSLCYPDESYSNRAAEIARKTGYVCALTIQEGLNKVGDDNMFFRRIYFPAKGSMDEVLAVVSGLTCALARIRKRFRNDLADTRKLLRRN
jgi:peptidoglycan/xylan/chitin deacetylase (PgdA/CDA1 family)